MSIRTVDLFCGIGGLSLGLEQAGYQIAGSFDYWDRAIKLYKENFSHPAEVFDLSNVDAAFEAVKTLKPDILVGGPPCQDFSHAGKRAEGERANLTLCYSQIVSKIMPEVFIMENVDRAQRSQAYQSARAVFKSSNYGLTEIVLDASRCGVPQRRKRFFCIGLKNGSDHFFESQILKNFSSEAMTVREYMGKEVDFEHYYRHPRNYNRRGVFSIDEPAPTMRGVNRPVPPSYPGHPSDTYNARMVKPLTTKERARIQTFPKKFSWIGTKTDLEQMIGNAVPVNLAQYIGKAVRQKLAV